MSPHLSAAAATRTDRHPGRLTKIVGTAALAALTLAAPASAAAPTAAPAADEPGYDVIFDGTQDSFDHWEYAGDGGFDLLDDGTIRSRAGAGGGFGTLWYPEQQYGDFSLLLEFRDDAPDDLRGNSGVQVRFPDLSGPVDGCPTTFNGSETNNLSWIAVNCGHEIQVNDSPEEGNNDPRKTGSIYGFADLDLEQAMPTEKGVWNELEVRVVGQHYTVIRNGVVINEYENLPGVPFPGRPEDPDSSSRGLVGHVGVQAHGSAPDVVSFRNIRVRELPPVTSEASVRCLGGTAYVAVRAQNLGDAPVDLTLATPSGERSFTAVQPQRNAYQSFSTRASSVEAGSVSLTVASDNGGEPVVVDTPYPATACG
ncbi:3-keto-disaccharide hydrolase [Cellulosimicrobium arenosum]|uniref:3-keto-disaccharide hydrolase n=1 Tax=Cellulosimicrobium arenosum TaxID=2708133 RepID=UPI001F50DC40|nr:DUF1080 domain-containing protein [Cellulosimicrobium arenosum]